jgi:hypothetical protein
MADTMLTNLKGQIKAKKDELRGVSRPVFDMLSASLIHGQLWRGSLKMPSTGLLWMKPSKKPRGS